MCKGWEKLIGNRPISFFHTNELIGIDLLTNELIAIIAIIANFQEKVAKEYSFSCR